MPTIPGTDLSVPPFVLGGNVFGWTADARDSYAVLDAFVAAGGTMIDTADSYAHWIGDGGGESETILGGWLADRGCRDRVLIATKVGKSPDNRGLSPAGIRAGLEGSLRRLGTDRIDLYYSHEDDPTVPMTESLAELDAAVRAGTVRYLGASNFTAARLREAVSTSQRHGLARYVALQPPYNLVHRDHFERDLAPASAELGLGVLAYYGLAKGFLTGKYRRGESSPAHGEAAQEYRTPFGEGVLDAVLEVADEHRTTAAAVALAWVASRPGVVAPIAAARTVEQLQDLLPALTLHLTSQDQVRLDEASDPSRTR